MTDTATSNTRSPEDKSSKVQALKSGAEDSIKETVTAAQDTVKQATDQASEEFRKLSQTSTAFVRDNPGVAVAGALGVGILVGLALRGRY